MGYGTKAFPNVALMRLLAEEGIGADVSTLGELRFAQAAGIAGERHGRPRQQQVRTTSCARRPQAGRSSCSTRSRRSTVRAPRASRRTLIRVTPGIEADTHEKIRTGHHGSKFGLHARRRARGAPPRARDRGAARPHRLAAPRPRRRRGWPSTGSRPSPPARASETRLGAPHDRPRRRARRRLDAGRAGALDRRVRRHGLLEPSSSGQSLQRRPRAAGRHPRARPLAHRPRRRHALHRRLGEDLGRLDRPTSRSTAACPTTPAPRSTAPATRPCSRTAPTRRPPAPTPSSASTASRATC